MIHIIQPTFFKGVKYSELLRIQNSFSFPLSLLLFYQEQVIMMHVWYMNYEMTTDKLLKHFINVYCSQQCRKTYCWSFNSPIILMCKSFGQRLIDNHLWRSKSRRQLLNIGCHKNSLQSWRIGPFLNTCSSLDLSLMNLWLWSCKLIRKYNGYNSIG